MRAARLLLLVACAGSPGPGGNPLPAEDSGAVDTCAAWSYAGEPTVWALPAGVALPRANGDADCETGAPTTRLWDLTGDGRLDLVVLSDCEDPTIGRSAWRVWAGVPDGFGAEMDWSLPVDFGLGAFSVPGRAAMDCADEELPAFFLADLDGDARDDLVVTESCTDETLAEGNWRVHTNTGTGFGEAMSRPIPYGASGGSFVKPQVAADCAAGVNVPAWALVDLDGDGPVDLVVTDTCTLPRVGAAEWQVLRGGAEGFADPVSWPIPTELAATTTEASVNSCPASPPRLLRDVDGDGRRDLLVPMACNESSWEWSVYPNLGAGFETTAVLHGAPAYVKWYVTAAERAEPDCARGYPAHVLDDATGDGFLDLTTTASCTDAALGDSRWNLYRGTPEAWLDPVSIALPTGYSSGAFAGTSSSEVGCGGNANRPAWARADLDGDGVPELIVTSACDDAAVGTSTWRVYPLTCAG